MPPVIPGRQLEGGPEQKRHQGGDTQTGYRVEPGGAETASHEPDEDEDRRQRIAAVVPGIRAERVRVDAPTQAVGVPEQALLDADGQQQDGQHPDRGIEGHGGQHPLDGGLGELVGCDGEKRGQQQGGDVLGATVAEGVFFIRRL